jgi:hypothetical protein
MGRTDESWQIGNLVSLNETAQWNVENGGEIKWSLGKKFLKWISEYY